jgi:hypothetical protein
MEWHEGISESHKVSAKLSSSEIAMIRLAVLSQTERRGHPPLITKSEFDALMGKVIQIRILGKKPLDLTRKGGRLVASFLKKD